MSPVPLGICGKDREVYLEYKMSIWFNDSIMAANIKLLTLYVHESWRSLCHCLDIVRDIRCARCSLWISELEHKFAELLMHRTFSLLSSLWDVKWWGKTFSMETTKHTKGHDTEYIQGACQRERLLDYLYENCAGGLHSMAVTLRPSLDEYN